MTGYISKILGLLIFFLFIEVQAKDNCTPDFELAKPTSIIQSTNTDDNEKSVFIYFDQSLSMQGYTKNQPGQNNLYVNEISVSLFHYPLVTLMIFF